MKHISKLCVGSFKNAHRLAGNASNSLNFSFGKQASANRLFATYELPIASVNDESVTEKAPTKKNKKAKKALMDNAQQVLQQPPQQVVASTTFDSVAPKAKNEQALRPTLKPLSAEERAEYRKARENEILALFANKKTAVKNIDDYLERNTGNFIPIKGLGLLSKLIITNDVRINDSSVSKIANQVAKYTRLHEYAYETAFIVGLIDHVDQKAGHWMLPAASKLVSLCTRKFTANNIASMFSSLRRLDNRSNKTQQLIKVITEKASSHEGQLVGSTCYFHLSGGLLNLSLKTEEGIAALRVITEMIRNTTAVPYANNALTLVGVTRYFKNEHPETRALLSVLAEKTNLISSELNTDAERDLRDALYALFDRDAREHAEVRELLSALTQLLQQSPSFTVSAKTVELAHKVGENMGSDVSEVQAFVSAIETKLAQ